MWFLDQIVGRDPRKSARNKRISEIKSELAKLWPMVSKESGYDNLHAFNALIGGKAATFIDLKGAVIRSQDEYVSLYFSGYKRAMDEDGWTAGGTTFRAATLRKNYEILTRTKNIRKYVLLFLQRAYLNHYDELVRQRPALEDAEIWFGQNNAEYGLFVAPRYDGATWANDQSEIRRFPKLYWTIGHVLHTGLVVDGDPEPMRFPDVTAYLGFFRKSLVRASGSVHERTLADKYCEYVRGQRDPETFPLLIPEFRYLGKARKHEYRLDFCIINPVSLNKVGFELSPWSTHGALSGVREKTQKQVNDEARGNFEKEMRKLRDFFRKHRIYSLIYTDTQLANPDWIFSEVREHLELGNEAQLELDLMKDFL